MSKTKARWNNEWLKIEDDNGDRIEDWCTLLEETGKVRCRLCCKDFLVKSGKTNLLSHASGDNHTKRSKANKRCSKINFAGSGTEKKQSLPTARTSELRLLCRVILKNHSFESYSDFITDLKAIAPDSKIPSEMKMGPDKIAYTIREAVYPHLKDCVVADVKKSEWYSLQIDEANKLKEFLGIVVRYVDPETLEPKVVCLDLPNLTCCDAKSISDTVKTSVISDIGMDPKQCLSVMSDNCNTMRGKFYTSYYKLRRFRAS